MSEARLAMERAAKHIADHPYRFQFFENSIPIIRFGKSACALGWIGHFQRSVFGRVLDAFKMRTLDDVAHSLGFKNEGEFYFEMNRVCERKIFRRHWTQDGSSCAATMRELAQERVR